MPSFALARVMRVRAAATSAEKRAGVASTSRDAVGIEVEQRVDRIGIARRTVLARQRRLRVGWRDMLWLDRLALIDGNRQRGVERGKILGHGLGHRIARAQLVGGGRAR